MSCVQPPPSAPSSASSGTRTPSRWISFVSSPPSVGIGVMVIPGASRGTRIIDMSSWRSPAPVRHTIRMWLARWA